MIADDGFRLVKPHPRPDAALHEERLYKSARLDLEMNDGHLTNTNTIMITPLIYITLSALLGTSVAIPLPRVSTSPAQLTCENLDFWLEYKRLGVDVPTTEFPQYDNLVADESDIVKVTIRSDNVELGSVKEYAKKVLSQYKDKQVQINVYALNVTLAPSALDQTSVQCTSYSDYYGRKYHKIDKYTKNGVRRGFTLPDGLQLNVFANAFTSPYTEADYNTARGESSRISQVDGYTECTAPDARFAVKVSKPGYLHMDFVESTGVTNLLPADNVIARFTPIKSSESNTVSEPVDPLFYWMYFACARTMSSWNYRSASIQQASFANQVAQKLTERLESLDSKHQTASLDSLSLLSQGLAQSIQNQYGVWNSTNGTFVPANVLVSKWSVDKLQSKLTKVTSAANSYSVKLVGGLNAGASDESRLQYLRDMSTLQSNAADSNEFALQQSMQEVISYNASMLNLAGQTSDMGKEVTKANEKFKTGVTNYKDDQTSKSVFSFFTSIINIGMGMAEGNVKDVFEGVTGFFESVQELTKLLEDMEDLNDLIKELDELMDESSLKMPMDTASLTMFVQQMGSGNFSDSLFTKEARAALLKLSEFDRATADNIALKYDTVAATITPLMKSSEENGIDGATDLEVAYKKLCVAGKASINSKIGYAQVKSDFARQLYQVITDKRSSNYIASQVAGTEASIVAQRRSFLSWGVPGAISMQSNLLDRLASICSQFYYTEAMECSIVSDKTLQAFSLQKMDAFVASVLKGAEALEDSAPLSRQAWTIVDQPLTISIDDAVGGGKQLKVSEPATPLLFLQVSSRGLVD
jgi:hypothetical protein